MATVHESNVGLRRSGFEKTENPVLVFDGACGFCTWIVGFLHKRMRGPVRFVPWQRAELAELGLSQKEAQDAAWWIDGNGKRLRGHEAVARALRACRPPWHTLGTILAWPGSRWVTGRLYEFVSSNRRHLPGTTPALQMKEEDAMAAPERLCNHGGCRCKIEVDERYCGDYCRDERYTGMESKAMTCRCGHEACSGPQDPAYHT